MKSSIFVTTTLLLAFALVGCNRSSTPKVEQEQTKKANENKAEWKSVTLHFEGFTKSKSGATWMAWPNKVKQALEGLEAVREIRMDLARDEFVVEYDATRTTKDKLIATSKQAGFPARVVPNAEQAAPLFFREALAKARREHKPIVLDFTASWCDPCQRMLRETFPAPMVAPLLERSVLVKIDTDEYPALAKRFGAVALPDLRFLSPDAQELRRFQGFQGPDAFAKALDGLLKEVAAESIGDNLIALSEGERELKEVFNRDVGNVRIVLVLSPTWGPCQNGARVVQNKVLDVVKSDKVKVYVVWTPVLSEDDGKAADNAVEAVPDDRAMHFWDDDKSLGFSLGKTVTLPRGRKLAWDVYFAFDAKAKWGDGPPKPAYWMHQLGNDERKLDGEKLKDYVLNALATSSPKIKPNRR